MSLNYLNTCNCLRIKKCYSLILGDIKPWKRLFRSQSRFASSLPWAKRGDNYYRLRRYLNLSVLLPLYSYITLWTVSLNSPSLVSVSLVCDLIVTRFISFYVLQDIWKICKKRRARLEMTIFMIF